MSVDLALYGYGVVGPNLGLTLALRGFADTGAQPGPPTPTPTPTVIGGAIVDVVGVWGTSSVRDPSLPRRASYVLRVAAGSSAVVRVTLLDSQAQPVILSAVNGDALVLTARRSAADSEPVFAHFGASTQDPGVYAVGILPVDTSLVPGSRLIWDVWVSMGGVQQQVVEPGELVVGARSYSPTFTPS